MKPSDEVVEAGALTLYNRVIGRWGMRPVDYIGANQTKTAAEIRDDVREVLAVVYSMILEDAAKVAEEHKFSEPSVSQREHRHNVLCANIASAIREMAREG